MAALATLILTSGCGPSDEPASAGPGEGVPAAVTVEGPGHVRMGDDAACEDGCTLYLPEGEPVEITAVAEDGRGFVEWSGDCPAFANPCRLVPNGGETITATFAPASLRLEVTGEGVGTFRVQPPGVDCDESCGIALDGPLDVAITITDEGDDTELGAWGGACEGAELDNYCLVSVDGETHVSKHWVRPPTAHDDQFETDQDTRLEVASENGVLSNDESPGEGDWRELTAEAVSMPEHGALELRSDGSFSYEPESDFSGEDRFSYIATDAHGGTSDPATATITVVRANEPPVVRDDTYETDEGTTLDVAAPGVLANDEDPDGDALTARLENDVGDGTLVLRDDGSFTYEPDEDFVGSDAFTYRARDGRGGTSSTATVAIEVLSTNEPPSFRIPDATVERDAPVEGPQEVPEFAQDIDPGAPDEAGQALSFEIERDSGDGPPFETEPSIAEDGTLRFEPAGPGTAVFEAVLVDELGARSNPQPFTIVVLPRLTLEKDGRGRVTSSPPGIDCGVGCDSASANFRPNETVTLTAEEVGLRPFQGWSGACSGTEPSCEVTLSSNARVGAGFWPYPPPSGESAP